MSNSLSSYFTGISAKRLRSVEVKPAKSNQHEINGTIPFRRFLGDLRLSFEGKLIYLNDQEDDIIDTYGSFTWYDTRENVDHRNPEYRLYYKANDVIKAADVGDLLIIGKTVEGQFLIIIAQKDSTAEKQLLWLFNLSEVQNKFIVKDLRDEKQDIGFAGKYIISSLGIETYEPEIFDPQLLIREFGNKFPSTTNFSTFARSTVNNVSPIEDPDETLMAWLDREEVLFRALEKIIVQEKLRKGFGSDMVDVDDFIGFSLSVQNRRKSRAGHSFENHLAVIFQANDVSFDKGKVTERNNKPDFLFPKGRYHDESFNIELLTMLGVKTTAKDRWRQVLSEAEKVKRKHLITLEPAISKNQTDEMLAQDLQLIVPKAILPSYTASQKDQIITLSDFIKIVSDRQRI